MNDVDRTQHDAERTSGRPIHPERKYPYPERKYADLALEDRVRLRKPHPCGSYEWRVVRLGADIGIKCLKCDHRVLLPRSTFERRVKRFVSRGAPSPQLGPQAPARPDEGEQGT